MRQIREHPTRGIYVENMTEHYAQSAQVRVGVRVGVRVRVRVSVRDCR